MRLDRPAPGNRLGVLCRAPAAGVAGLVLAALVSAGCGADTAAVEDAGAHAVATESFTFVDDTRETPAFGGSPSLPTRTVVTDVWYPSDDDGPFPLIVFNHGQQGEPQQYAPSFERWASAGYVVAAPRHPLTIKGGPGAQFANDIPGEIGDVAFTIDSIGDELGGLADLDHIAVAGHSSGAVVAFGVGFNTCCHDDRVDAVLTESLFDVPLDGEYAEDLHGTPVLLVHGSTDVNPVGQSQTAYDRSGPPRFLLVVEGGNHSEMYRSGPEAATVAGAALRFFDFALKGDDGAADDLAALPAMQADPG